MRWRRRSEPETAAARTEPTAAIDPWQVLAGFALYAACATFMLWHVRILARPDIATRELVGWAALALLPALVTVLWPRARWYVFPLLVLLVTVLVIGNQTGHWPFRPHLLGHTGYFASVWHDIGTGAAAWISVTLPFDPDVDPELRTAVTTATVLLLMLAAGSILVWRAPLLAVLATFVPFAVVSTVFRVGDDILRSSIMLGLALVLTGAVDRRRLRTRPGLAAGIGLGVVALALGVAAVPGVAKGAYLPWRTWSETGGTGVSVGSYVWDQTYGPLVWPKETTEVLRVRSPYGTNWRATVLEHFDGLTWSADPVDVATATNGTVEFPANDLSDAAKNAKSSDRYEVGFRNTGLNDPYILTATGAETTSVAGVTSRAGTLHISDQGVIQADSSALRSTWTNQTVRVNPTPEQLNAAKTAYPADVVARDLVLLQDVAFPAWGAPDREQQVQAILARQFFDPRVSDWKKVYDQARVITKDATTPYEAAVALETYFQKNFKYDESADYSTASNGPLPAFFLGKGRNGYCQMFSGSMTTILRMLGIPARVAEGFTSGKLDTRSRRWVVTNRNAHAWVEVYFPGYGWLPFEPTPTRALDASFSGTSSGFDAAAQAAAAGSALLAEILRDRGSLNADAASGGGGRVPLDDRAGIRSPLGPGGITGSVPSGSAPDPGWRPGVFTFLILGATLLAALLMLVKRFRVIHAYVARDPHAIAAAVRGDLQAWVVDQGIADGGRALTPNEFGDMLKREFAVDASAWARQHTRARYGPADGSHHAAVAARAEARHVKKRIRASLTAAERLRGAVDLRSLVP